MKNVQNIGMGRGTKAWPTIWLERFFAILDEQEPLCMRLSLHHPIPVENTAVTIDEFHRRSSDFYFAVLLYFLSYDAADHTNWND